MSKDDIPEALWTGKCPGHLLARSPVRVRTAIGEEYEISESTEGHLRVWARSGETLLARSECSNVVQIVSWPLFQPIVPPTTKRPVIASRDMVMDVLRPKHNGLGSEALEAVQRALDNQPDLRALIEEVIKETLHTEKSSAGYDNVKITDVPAAGSCPGVEFETRIEAWDEGRKLYQCIVCERVFRTARTHPKPGPTTRSYDKTMQNLFAYAVTEGA